MPTVSVSVFDTFAIPGTGFRAFPACTNPTEVGPAAVGAWYLRGSNAPSLPYKSVGSPKYSHRSPAMIDSYGAAYQLSCANSAKSRSLSYLCTAPDATVAS